MVRPLTRARTGTVPLLRTRLAAAAVLSLSLLPGCRLCCPDPCGNGYSACRRGGMCDAIPVSYPVGDAGCNGCGMPIPAGGPIVAGPYGGAPIIGGPVYPNGGLTETLPPPYAPPGTPRIPKAGIDEGKGKQFELEGASRSGTGPVLAVPATGTR
jgi:hypothetical protein